jgi:hypothetical protein
MRSVSERVDGRAVGLVWSLLPKRLLLRGGGLTLILQTCVLGSAILMFDSKRRDIAVGDVSGRI